MPETLDIKQTVWSGSVNYKAKGGEIKEIKIIQNLEPGQVHMTFADIQMLAKQIAVKLQEDAQ
jgi:hypothetical protein